MAGIIEIFYSNPCSRPLVDKDHVPIKICSQEKIMDDIQREWKGGTQREEREREKNTPSDAFVSVFDHRAF